MEGRFIVSVFLLTTSSSITARSSSPSVKCGPCHCWRDRHEQYMNCFNVQSAAIPAPPPDFTTDLRTSIFFERSNVRNLTKNLFKHVSSYRVVFLGLRNNSIQTVTRSAFANLTHLDGLDISGNKLNIDELNNAFKETSWNTFRQLNLSTTGIDHIPVDLLLPFSHSSKLNLSLYKNNLTEMNTNAFVKIPNLYKLDLGFNCIEIITLPSNFSSDIVHLNLNNNLLRAFPNLCINSSKSFFPRLTFLDVSWNFLRTFESDFFRCLDRLEVFYLNGNLLHELRSNEFADLKSIRKIYLSEIFNLNSVKGAPFNNSNLKKVFFRKNALYTEKADCNLNMFEGCTSLDLLNMADNILDKIKDEEFENLFRPLTSLKILIMGGCRLSKIPNAVLKYLPNLEELVLYNNRIGTWPTGTLNSLPKLSRIYMRQNVITSLTEASFPPNFKTNAVKVDFSSNPFHCTCDLKWFVTWMERSPKTFALRVIDLQYKCETPASFSGVNLTKFPLSDEVCVLNDTSKIITLVVSCTLIAVLVLGALAYRNKWHIRYCIYMLRYKARQKLDTRTFTYDAFVAYSDSDRHWVFETLMPILEGSATKPNRGGESKNQDGLKLCIHHRDFEVGKLIVDNIVDCIEDSRCLLIILSNSFAQSNWCMFEMELIQRRTLEDDERLLVVVLLEDIHSRYVTKSMRAMLQTTTYILWGEEEAARKAFFNRLRMLLQKQKFRYLERRVSL